MESFWLYITTAFALVFVIEGMLWACFPDAMRRLMMMALSMPPENLRRYGAGMVMFGFTLVYLIDLFAS